MVDKDKLNKAIERSGLKKKAIAFNLGISDHALNNKINNITAFKVSEVLALEDILRLNENETRAIFFNRDVENNSTLGKLV